MNAIEILRLAWTIFIVPPVRLRFQRNLGGEVCVAVFRGAHHALDQVFRFLIRLLFDVFKISRSSDQIGEDTSVVMCASRLFECVVNIFLCLTSKHPVLRGHLFEARHALDAFFLAKASEIGFFLVNVDYFDPILYLLQSHRG